MKTQLSRVFTLMCVVILFAACGEVPTGTVRESESPSLAKKPPAPPETTVPLTAFFRASATDAIASDSLGTLPWAYDGIFRENGSFITSAYNQGREYSFTFDPDVADLEPYEVLPADGRYTGYISTGAPGSLGATAIYPEPDPEGRTSGVVLWQIVTEALPKDIVTSWYLYFGTDCALTEKPEKRFVVAYNAEESVWTLGDPGPGQENWPILCRSPRKGEKGLQTVGKIYMPFLVTMTLP